MTLRHLLFAIYAKVTKSDHEFHFAQVIIYDETSFAFCTAYSRRVKRSTEAFVKKQCESDLDEIFSSNSTFLFGYKLCFYDKSFQDKYSVIFSHYMKSILVPI